MPHIWLSVLAIAFVLQAGSSAGQGTISGCITDSHGGKIPGVAVVASRDGVAAARAITEDDGCFQVTVPAGTYEVRGSLAGFADRSIGGVRAVAGTIADHVDLVLCTTGALVIDWIAPGTLADAWKRADVVVDARIVATRPHSRSGCPNEAVVHRASVAEVFKKDGNWRNEAPLEFRQEIWQAEQIPYPVGQRLVLFLARSSTSSVLIRTAGPASTFLLDGDRLVPGRFAPLPADVRNTADFLALLRAMGR